MKARAERVSAAEFERGRRQTVQARTLFAAI